MSIALIIHVEDSASIPSSNIVMLTTAIIDAKTNIYTKTSLCHEHVILRKD